VLTVGEHITSLGANYKPDDHVLLAWWDKEWFEEMLGRALTASEWEVAYDAALVCLEGTDLGDQMVEAAETALSEQTGLAK
jgi:hypothetical protein